MELQRINLLQGLLLILLISTQYTHSEQTLRGSFCITTRPQEECDYDRTSLYCYEGKCQCPETLKMSGADLPPNLSTIWYAPLGKCMALKGSMCEIHPTKKRIECLPGYACVPNPKSPTVTGTCGGSSIELSGIAILPLLAYGCWKLIN